MAMDMETWCGGQCGHFGNPPKSVTTATSNDFESKLIASIQKDDKERLNALTSSPATLAPSNDAVRKVASRLLHACCSHDSVSCVAALFNGELLGGVIPLVNGYDEDGMSPLHAAATANAARCVEYLLKKQHARADLKTRDGCGLLPLQLSLLSTRMDVVWDPDHHSIEDLVVQLSEKNLTAVKLLSEKTKEIGEVAYGAAIGGKVVDLAVLLIVAAEKVNGYIVELHVEDSSLKEKASVYECVIREALALGRLAAGVAPSLRAAKRGWVPTENESAEKRKLMISEIELLQLFDAVALSSGDKKVGSPLLWAAQAGDLAVIELLLNSNLDVNDVDAEGNSALHWCLKISKGSCPQQMKIMVLLLSNGARANLRNKLGLNSVHIAAANGNSKALQVLLSADRDSINSKTEMKETPLFFAVKNDSKECAELLLRWGANTEVFNLRKQRPIDLAESQDMRVVLNQTNICLTNHALPIQQKYTARLQGDEVISETCEELSTKSDESYPTDISTMNLKTEVCKYFETPGGCVRGNKCFYVHAEEDLCQMKKGKMRCPNARELDRKIFVGGLPPSLDSDSLHNFCEQQFGPVDDAIVLGFQTGEKIQSRGFGFVTFKHKKSASAATEAHYISVMGKQVEIKSVVPKYLLTQQYEQEQSYEHLLPSQKFKENTDKGVPHCQIPNETTKDCSNWQTPTDKTEKEMSTCRSTEDINSKLMIDALGCCETKASLNESLELDKTIPTWLRTFKKWLPGFLKWVSKKEGEYALSSLKADFRTKFGLELDHTSLGFPKLSDFMKSFSDVCFVKYVPIGDQKPANHMILVPRLPKPRLQAPKTLMTDSPSSHATSVDGGEGDPDDNTKCLEDVTLVSNGSGDFTGGSTEVPNMIPEANPEEASASKRSRFTEFLMPDPLFHGRAWLKGMNPMPQPKHLVLEALARKMKNSSVYFLREYDFYDKYKASIKRGLCFGCNKGQALWANFPCQHLLWCSDCKVQVTKAATGSECKCVLCDLKVQKIDLIRWHQHCQPLREITHSGNSQLPTFAPAYIRNLSEMKVPLMGI